MKTLGEVFIWSIKMNCWEMKAKKINHTGDLWLTSRQTVVSDWRAWTRQSDRTGLFRVRCTSFHIHFPLLTFFLCFIVLFQSCCSHAQVFGKTLVHEFPIFYNHTEWNLLSSGTNTLLWWRACFKILYYKQNHSGTESPSSSNERRLSTQCGGITGRHPAQFRSVISTPRPPPFLKCLSPPFS